MVVGHMPHLPRLLRLLLTGDADAPSVEFPLNGVVCLEKRAGAWTERLAAVAAGPLRVCGSEAERDTGARAPEAEAPQRQVEAVVRRCL